MLRWWLNWKWAYEAHADTLAGVDFALLVIAAGTVILLH